MIDVAGGEVERQVPCGDWVHDVAFGRDDLIVSGARAAARLHSCGTLCATVRARHGWEQRGTGTNAARSAVRAKRHDCCNRSQPLIRTADDNRCNTQRAAVLPNPMRRGMIAGLTCPFLEPIVYAEYLRLLKCQGQAGMAWPALQAVAMERFA